MTEEERVRVQAMRRSLADYDERLSKIGNPEEPVKWLLDLVERQEARATEVEMRAWELIRQVEGAVTTCGGYTRDEVIQFEALILRDVLEGRPVNSLSEAQP